MAASSAWRLCSAAGSLAAAGAAGASVSSGGGGAEWSPAACRFRAPRVPCANGEPPGGGLAAAVFKWESAGIALPVGGAASSSER